MTPDKIIVHCSDTPNGKDCDIMLIESWHVARGFDSVGYHYLIQPDGMVQVGRPLNIRGAHTKGHNEGSIGICIIGRDKFTWEQFWTLRKITEDLRLLYDIQPWMIRGHYEFSAKTCPNIPASNLSTFACTGDKRSLSAYVLRD